MSGGYRQGSGRSKSGYYKGIFCGSTYELCWVIYSIDHQILFKRFSGFLENCGVKYYPDFLLADGNTIIETKGYELQESVDKKTKVAESFGYVVKVLRKDDLQFAFDYVINTYGTKKFYDLYDGYKPTYEYICSHCNFTFRSDTRRNTALVYCSRSCSMKSTSNIHRKENNKKISQTLTGKTPKPYVRKYKQIWITNGIETTRIRATDTIPLGFNRGR